MSFSEQSNSNTSSKCQKIDGTVFTSVLDSMGNYSYISLWFVEIKALQRPLSPAHQGTKLKPSFYLFWVSLWPIVCTCVPMHTHTVTYTDSQTQGILSEVDPYQVLCQSPEAMRYLVLRICLNTLSSLFGSTDWNTTLKWVQIIHLCDKLRRFILSGIQTQKKRDLSLAECLVGHFPCCIRECMHCMTK